MMKLRTDDLKRKPDNVNILWKYALGFCTCLSIDVTANKDGSNFRVETMFSLRRQSTKWPDMCLSDRESAKLL